MASKKFKIRVYVEAQKIKGQFSAKSIARRMHHPILYKALVESALKQLMREGKVHPGYVGMYRVTLR